MAESSTERTQGKSLRLTVAQVLAPISESLESLRYSSGAVTQQASHVRDGISARRISTVVVVAVLPAVVLGVYNAGLQINAAVARGAPSLDRWQSQAMELLGLELAPESLIAGLLHGGLYFLPLLVAVYFTGRLCELVFALSRREQLSEGLWPVALIFTLMLPPTTPLWQAVLAIVFGVVIGKEIFGGTGRNVVSPILLAWLFLWVAYPATLSGDRIWVAAGVEQSTALDIVVEQGGGAWTTLSWRDAFLGFTPGSFGEPSNLTCLIGLMVLLVTRVASWRVVTAFVVGSAAGAMLFAGLEPDTNPLFGMPLHWHMVLGGWAFGAAFLVTDPVTSAHTNTGRWVYGFVAGVFVILVRVLNPAHADGTVVALLFVSLFAPFIDYWVIRANVRRRRVRCAAK